MLRAQLFHISSHIGDDYMLRNEYYKLNDKSVNYEQFDIVYLFSHDLIDTYGGVGYVVSSNTFRERIMIQLGMQGVVLISNNIEAAFCVDSKLYEEQSFSPNIHGSFGVSLKSQNKRHINFSIDAFSGHIPYSTLKMGQVFGLGISTNVYI